MNRKMKELDIQLVRRQPAEVRAGAAPYTLYVGGEFWCTCDSLREADEEIAALAEGRDVV